MRAIETLKDIVGDRPVVMDREFSCLGFLQDLEAAQVSFVLRLNQGTHPKFQDSEGQKAVDRDVGYKGWSAFGSGVTPNPWEPEEALRMYLQRMKIDATFRDLKDLPGWERRMNRSQESMEKMVALLYRAPRGGESERLPVRAAAFGVEGTRRVSRPAGAGRPGSPDHPFPRARESSGSATPVCSYSSCRSGSGRLSRGGPSSGRLGLPSWLSSFLLSQLMSELEL
jgi:hypothetical protein